MLIIFDFGTVLLQVIAFAGLGFVFYLFFLSAKALRKYLKR